MHLHQGIEGSLVATNKLFCQQKVTYPRTTPKALGHPILEPPQQIKFQSFKKHYAVENLQVTNILFFKL